MQFHCTLVYKKTGGRRNSSSNTRRKNNLKKKKKKKNTRVVTVSISSIISYSNRVVLFFSRNAVKFVDFDAQHEVTLTVSLVWSREYHFFDSIDKWITNSVIASKNELDGQAAINKNNRGIKRNKRKRWRVIIMGQDHTYIRSTQSHVYIYSKHALKFI
jgi:hypothetical protein